MLGFSNVDEPERVGAEANILRQYEEFQSLPTIEALKHRYAPVWIDIRDLLSLIDAQRHAISVSEKRAEELQADLNAEIVAHVATAKERDSSQKRAEEAEQRCEGMKAELTLAMQERYAALAIAAGLRSERDSSQASLLRAVEIEREECAKVAEWACVTVPMTEGRSGTVIATRQAIAEAIRARTALSPHKEDRP